MAAFRLKYPAMIYVTVTGADLDAAKQTLHGALKNVEGGIGVNRILTIDQFQDTEEIVYPDCEGDGIDITKIELEDEEDETIDYAAVHKETLDKLVASGADTKTIQMAGRNIRVITPGPAPAPDEEARGPFLILDEPYGGCADPKILQAVLGLYANRGTDGK